VIASLDLAVRELEAGTAAGAGESALLSIGERVRDANQGAERVRAVMRDLMIFSRVQDAHPTAVDVRTALAGALHMSHNEIRHRAKVVRDLRDVPLIWAQEGRVGQLFLNLVMNAAHAIPEGDVEANEIRVRTFKRDDGWAVAEVSDTGVGIPPDVLPKIFDAFFTTKPVGLGTGLGLAICSAIAQDIGGRIEVESKPGQGTTFRVLLPPALAPSQVGERPPSVPPATGARRGSVLVVDDEPLIRKVVAGMLASEHEVTCEPDANAALDRIRRGERFDVILCDLMMPQTTGMDLYEALLKLEPHQAQRMLFLTGGAFTARAQAFLDRVPNATIEKPFDAATLVTRVRRLVD
jgi:CheY-like chemotaxis protein